MDAGIKETLGLLGRIPDCVTHGPAGSGIKWKALSERAMKCQKMRDKEKRLAEADRITKEYHDLIAECKDFLDRKRSN